MDQNPSNFRKFTETSQNTPDRHPADLAALVPTGPCIIHPAFEANTAGIDEQPLEIVFPEKILC